jgi:phospholipid N-methyltransferase
VRRFYQESWQGIPFTAFSHASFFRLAEPRFYAAFYEELFRRYQSWDELPVDWRTRKRHNACWLAGRLAANIAAKPPDRQASVLSIGSGIGYMEHILLEKIPNLALHVNEPSTVSMKWLRKHIPSERIYIGLPPACLPPDITYDMIYLSAVDYGIPTRELLLLLRELRAQLDEGGEIICISASLLEEDTLVGALVNAIKIFIRGVLHYLGIRRQQFWGWRRTREEYRQLFRQAGFTDMVDGYLDDGETYWIGGR